jgi:hypothetical protein
MKLSTSRRALTAMAVCGVIGASAGIAGAGAASSSSKSKARSTQVARSAERGRFMMGGPPVHAVVVRLNKAGDAFITETDDNGIVKSVSGSDLTITEGTKTVTYKDATITIPSGATVYRNGSQAQLSDLAAGDHVHVDQSSDGTTVMAFDADHAPGPGGPHGDHDGPPPGPPPAGAPPAGS